MLPGFRGDNIEMLPCFQGGRIHMQPRFQCHALDMLSQVRGHSIEVLARLRCIRFHESLDLVLIHCENLTSASIEFINESQAERSLLGKGVWLSILRELISTSRR